MISKSKLWGKPVSIVSSATGDGFPTQHSKRSSRTLLDSTKCSKNDDGLNQAVSSEMAVSTHAWEAFSTATGGGSRQHKGSCKKLHGI